MRELRGPFIVGSNHPTQRACSVTCGAVLRIRGLRRVRRGCIECGKKFIGYPKQKYCSPRCTQRRIKREGHRAKVRAERGDLAPPKKCDFCGAEFTPKFQGWAWAKFCSQQCKQKHRYGAPRVGECDICGEEIPKTLRADRQTCSDACERKRKRDKARVARFNRRQGKTAKKITNKMPETRERAWYRARAKAEALGEEFNEPRPTREANDYDDDSKAKPEGWDSIV